MKREWYYKGTDYCRPVLSYTEVVLILDALKYTESQVNMIPPELYRKMLHQKNLMEEKRAFDEK